MYFVAELVDGGSVRGLTPPLRKCLDIAAQIADAVAAASPSVLSQFPERIAVGSGKMSIATGSAWLSSGRRKLHR
jgi:hypothetical protein